MTPKCRSVRRGDGTGGGNEKSRRGSLVKERNASAASRGQLTSAPASGVHSSSEAPSTSSGSSAEYSSSSDTSFVFFMLLFREIFANFPTFGTHRTSENLTRGHVPAEQLRARQSQTIWRRVWRWKSALTHILQRIPEATRADFLPVPAPPAKSPPLSNHTRRLFSPRSPPLRLFCIVCTRSNDERFFSPCSPPRQTIPSDLARRANSVFLIRIANLVRTRGERFNSTAFLRSSIVPMRTIFCGRIASSGLNCLAGRYDRVDRREPAHAFPFRRTRRSLQYLPSREPLRRGNDRSRNLRTMFELYGMNKDTMVYRSPPPRRKEVDILETCLQLSSPELMRKLPNGDAVHHTKESHVSTSLDRGKDKDPPRESGRSMLRRWIVMAGFFFLGCALVAGVGLPLALELRSSHLLEARLQVVRRMLSEIPLIDGHNDFAWKLRKHRGSTKLQDFPFDEDLSRNASWGSDWQTDLVRLREGIVGGQFWSVYVPCEAQFLDAVQLTLEQIDVVRRLAARYPKRIRLASSSKELEKAHKDGVIGSLVGIEGGHSIGTSMAVLRSFHRLGARYMTLTHKCNTPWADSCSVEDPNSDAPMDFHSDGLSVFGKAVVRELNRLGMLVDLSHVSIRTMRDALAVTKAPVIFSHSAARALCNSSSNVPDDVLRNLSVNGGLVMVSFDSAHLSCGEKASMHDVIAHINHIRRIAGVNHVGLGAGYDGIPSAPAELPDVSGYPLLLAELTRDRRWSASDIKKLVGGNLLRVFKEVEDQATTMSHQSPSEELIPQELIEDTAYCRYHDA